MGKNIWVFHHYADPPDGHWTGTYDLYKHLVQKGHRITIYSSSFSHYTLREERLEPHQNYKEEYFNDVRFIFVRTTPYIKNDYRRILNMLSYAIRAYWIGSNKKETPDIIVGAMPHQFCGLIAALLARKKRARFFLELHDLWLEYLIDTNKLSAKNPLAIVLRWIDRFCYKKAENILTLWSKMDRYLEQFGVAPDKIVWMPLGIDIDGLERDGDGLRDSKEPFVVMCTARFGPEANISEILKAAKLIQDDGHNNVRFVLIGTGPEMDTLVRFVSDSNLKNVEFRNLVPKDKLRKILTEADVCIGSLPDVSCYSKFGIIPTKMIEYLATNRPVVYITNDENCLVKRAGAGLVISPGDPKALAQAIAKLTSMSVDERALMGENGLKYLKQNHDLKVLAERLESLL